MAFDHLRHYDHLRHMCFFGGGRFAKGGKGMSLDVVIWYLAYSDTSSR